MRQPNTLVFDLGNVLIGWEPRALYRKLFAGRDEEMEWFLDNICTPAWNLEQDRGRSFASAVAELVAQHPPQWHGLIEAYHERWPEMLTGAIEPTVELLERLHTRGTPLYALTNWNHETFQHARERYPFLKHFRGIVVSGEEGCVKPEPDIYHRLLGRYQLDPQACALIDDSLPNVQGALAVGMHAIHFQSPQQLSAALTELGFPV